MGACTSSPVRGLGKSVLHKHTWPSICPFSFFDPLLLLQAPSFEKRYPNHQQIKLTLSWTQHPSSFTLLDCRVSSPLVSLSLCRK